MYECIYDIFKAKVFFIDVLFVLWNRHFVYLFLNMCVQFAEPRFIYEGRVID